MSDDYIPALKAAKILKMSPEKFANLLRQEKENLPVKDTRTYSDDENGLLKKQVWHDMFYHQDIGKTEPEVFLASFVVHKLDLIGFISDIKGNRGGLEQKISELEAENKQLKERITELETELAACREQLEEARREISGKKEHETAHGEEFPAEYEGHGLCSLVIRMRKEGQTEEEIAATLRGSGKWCSVSQIGALLHRGGNISAASMSKHAQRLLGKA